MGNKSKKITVNNQTTKKKRKWPIILFIFFILILLAISCYAVYYFSNYTKNTDKNALKDTASSTVKANDDCIFIDGPGTSSALIFYPDLNIESEAYCALLKPVADSGTDVLIAKPFFHFQLFQPNQAESLMNEYKYTKWSIGGHGQGGFIAAGYVESHSNIFHSVVLTGAYSDKNLTSSIKSGLVVGGSNDKITVSTDIENNMKNLPPNSVKFIIQGGNHAQFGNYGTLENDGLAAINPTKQQQQASDQIIQFLQSH